MGSDKMRLQSLAKALTAIGVPSEPLRVPDSVAGKGNRNALRVFTRRCPVAGTPLKSVLVFVKDDLFWWGYNATHPVNDPKGAALAVRRTIAEQNAAYPLGES
ncbi:hypothetical protein [Actinomadura macra]|uniref:hypothetical protein n=1 Tax=Actinomadura macra TaxID=46164 RepID=UPI000B1759A7|nr:hypothetical protein [Actinomadura macra]